MLKYNETTPKELFYSINKQFPHVIGDSGFAKYFDTELTDFVILFYLYLKRNASELITCGKYGREITTVILRYH